MTDTHPATQVTTHHQTIIEGTRPSKWLFLLFKAFVAFGVTAILLFVANGIAIFLRAPAFIAEPPLSGAWIMCALAILMMVLMLVLGPFLREPFREVIEYRASSD